MRESDDEGALPGGSGTVEAMAGADAEETTVVDESRVFGDIVGKIRQAVREEVAERRRPGLPIVVDRGSGVEVLGPWRIVGTRAGVPMSISLPSGCRVPDGYPVCRE
jgi:hypothetical protein